MRVEKGMDFFHQSLAMYNLFGGARGGGKSWCVQRKSVSGCMEHPGLRVLVVRRRYDDLTNSVIEPTLALVEGKCASYNKNERLLTFFNGSCIQFGDGSVCGSASTDKYQGQKYDWIFIEEATQLTEQEFREIEKRYCDPNSAIKRIYMTANPGGIGQQWVKRLFITRDYLEGENPEDYAFFKATVEDNVDLVKNSPDYINALELLPVDIRNAHRYGVWDVEKEEICNRKEGTGRGGCY